MGPRTTRVVVVGCVLVGCALAGRWTGERLGLGRPASAATDGSLEGFLAQHYGERWTAVRKRLIEGEYLSELRLSGPMEHAAPEPWDVVRERVAPSLLEPFADRAKLGSFLSELSTSEIMLQAEPSQPRDVVDPSDPYADLLLNPKARVLDESARAYLDRMSESVRGRLQELTDLAMQRVELGVRDKLERGDLLRYPAGQPGVGTPPDGVQRKPTGSYRYVDCLTDGGWCIVLEVDSQDDQELNVIVVEILGMKRQWVFDVRAYIDSMP